MIARNKFTLVYQEIHIYFSKNLWVIIIWNFLLMDILSVKFFERFIGIVNGKNILCNFSLLTIDPK
jgi:hypothetical protein